MESLSSIVPMAMTTHLGPSMPALLLLGNASTSGGLGVECLQPSLDVSGKLCVSSSCISSFCSVQVFGRTCQRSTQTLDSGGTMLDGGSLASHSCQHVGRCSWALSHHKRSCHRCLVGHVLKGMWYLHLSLWLLRDVCCVDRGSLPQSIRQWWGQLECLWWSSNNAGRNGQVGVFKRVHQTMPYLPLI